MRLRKKKNKHLARTLHLHSFQLFRCLTGNDGWSQFLSRNSIDATQVIEWKRWSARQGSRVTHRCSSISSWFCFVFDTCSSVFSPLLDNDTYSSPKYPTEFAAWRAMMKELVSLDYWRYWFMKENWLLNLSIQVSRSMNGELHSILFPRLGTECRSVGMWKDCLKTE